ncbi:MAG: T9SS type A sorting domain-containing protein [bacterium]
MKAFVIFLLILIALSASAQRVVLKNPIMFVAQVPVPLDSTTVTGVFCNHKANMIDVGRGSDLCIVYPDGTLRNLTEAAGYGMSGLQGANAIAVRQPSIHWSGKKALFSMIVGGSSAQGELGTYLWQIYEISNFGEHETPVITKVANQPPNFNNVSPIYGTDERIIFTSDRTRGGLTYLYPLRDEQFGFPAVTGLWSLDLVTGDLFQMNVSPSGVFTPFIDSYDRVIFTRWDLLQRDKLADKDILGNAHNGSFNFADETDSTSIAQSRTEIFPEPQSNRRDLLKGTNMNGLNFNQLFPWQINEDGTSEETLNHVGRHELLNAIQASINDDTNVVDFAAFTSGRVNIGVTAENLLQLSEDPNSPGKYYAISFFNVDLHSTGQIVTLDGRPSIDPSAMKLTYITHPSTVTPTPPAMTPDPENSGHYRNPFVLSDGRLLAVHTPVAYKDSNIGMRSHPLSRYELRIKTMLKQGDYLVADSAITPGFYKTVSYWDPDTLVTYSGLFWELDPVEVRSRIKPQRRSSTLASPESAIFTEEGVNESAFRETLRRSNAALLVSRNVTHRDKSDHQQPYYLKVHGSETVSDSARGKVYDVAHIEYYQADQIRGYTNGNPLPTPGRRVLPQYIHDSVFRMNHQEVGERSYSINISSDGSYAAIVPARRALTWALSDSNFSPVVRERYWITTQPGEIRVCASCHGTNDEALVSADPAPQNKPEALRSLLKYWKQSHAPLSPELVSPPNSSANIPIETNLVWNSSPLSNRYRVFVSTLPDFATTFFTSDYISDTTLTLSGLIPPKTYYWKVLAYASGTDSAYSGTWSFTTGKLAIAPPDAPRTIQSVSNFPNPFSTTTTIDFVLEKNSNVKVQVLDLFGEIVATVADKFYEAGSLKWSWDAKSYPPGFYTVQIITETSVNQRKIMVLH